MLLTLVILIIDIVYWMMKVLKDTIHYSSDRFVSLDKIRDKKIEMLLWE